MGSDKKKSKDEKEEDESIQASLSRSIRGISPMKRLRPPITFNRAPSPSSSSSSSGSSSPPPTSITVPCKSSPSSIQTFPAPTLSSPANLSPSKSPSSSPKQSPSTPPTAPPPLPLSPLKTPLPSPSPRSPRSARSPSNPPKPARVKTHSRKRSCDDRILTKSVEKEGKKKERRDRGVEKKKKKREVEFVEGKKENKENKGEEEEKQEQPEEQQEQKHHHHHHHQQQKQKNEDLIGKPSDEVMNRYLRSPSPTVGLFDFENESSSEDELLFGKEEEEEEEKRGGGGGRGGGGLFGEPDELLKEKYGRSGSPTEEVDLFASGGSEGEEGGLFGEPDESLKEKYERRGSGSPIHEDLFASGNDYLEPDLEEEDGAGSLPGTGMNLITQFYKNKKTRGEESYATFEGEDGGEGEEDDDDGPPVFEEFGESGEPKSVSMGVRSREIPHSSLQYVCPLGEGAFGVVYKALLWDTPVAVKELRNVDVRTSYIEITKELSTLAELRHPNCVLLLGYSPPPNAAIICEYLDCGSLWSILQNPKVRLEKKQILRVAKLIARGLLYLHEHDPPIFHRDIKSQNVLIGGDLLGKWHSVKVADFGLSTLSQVSEGKKPKKEKVGWCGSVQWRAPETAFEYTAKSDIFSYGVLLWELITRKVPWEGLEPLDVWEKVKKGERLGIPRHAPPPYRALIENCWDDDPKNRPTWSQILDKIKEMSLEKPGSFRKAGSMVETARGGEGAADPGIRAGSMLEPGAGGGRQKVVIEGRSFEIDDPREVKLSSLQEATTISDSQLLMSLPPYVVPSRMVSVVFHHLLSDEGVGKYMSLSEMSLCGRVAIDLSMVLRDSTGNKMYHFFLYDKEKIVSEDLKDSLSEESSEKSQMKEQLTENVAHCSVTPFVFQDMEGIVYPISPSVKYAMICHVTLREETKTVASLVYSRQLVPWAMKGGLWKGGMTLTHYNHGKAILVNLFSKEEDRETFVHGGSYNHVLQRLATFLSDVPIMEYCQVDRLKIKRPKWIQGGQVPKGKGAEKGPGPRPEGTKFLKTMTKWEKLEKTTPDKLSLWKKEKEEKEKEKKETKCPTTRMWDKKTSTVGPQQKKIITSRMGGSVS